MPTSVIKGVVGISGPYDFYPFDSDSTKAAFGNAPDPETTQPINHVRSDAPPMLLIHGEKDTLVYPRNTRVLSAAITEAGGAANAIYFEQMDHTAPLMALATHGGVTGTFSMRSRTSLHQSRANLQFRFSPKHAIKAHMRILSHLIALIGALSLLAQPAAAQSVLRDAETEALLQDMAKPLALAAGLAPGNLEIVLINDPSINAFVAGGQTVYLHSGLIDAADTANEVQGVIAHEIGHITGGHIIRSSEGMGKATNISILSMVLGVAAALAGAGEAAMGVMAAGQQAAMGSYLSFSRVQESSADAAGAEFLSTAGISGRGSLSFFKKLQNQEFRYGVSQSDDAAFARTHPLSGDRIARLRETYVIDPAWDTPDDAAVQIRFERVKAKLFGYLTEPARVLQSFPASRTDIPARYARAYAYHKNAQIDQALAETSALLESDPDDPYFLELQGQVLLESGRPQEALVSLRKATELTNNQPLIASIFGHALIATEDQSNYSEAEQVLRLAVARDRYNPFAWYQLGVVYAAEGDMPRARLASAEQQVMRRDYAEAIRSAQAAEAGLPTGSPDWIRAQDIEMQARAELERQPKRR